MVENLIIEGEDVKVFSDIQAKHEASRCFYCYDAPCMNACPANVDVPTFIKRISTGDYKGAIRAIKKTNVFPATCALVCPQEVLCEGACTHNLLKTPISIGKLQHFAATKELEISFIDDFENVETLEKEKKVAIIGGGPAGLSAAVDLRKAGAEVDIYEKQPELGGVLRYGIPSYRLPDAVFKKEIENIINLGVNSFVNVEESDLTNLVNKDYDAILITTGLTIPNKLDMNGIELENVHDAWTFLEKVKNGEITEISGKVVVAGGGNVAIDAALTAKALGADEVSISYRRTRKEMPAWNREYNTALKNDIKFMFLTNPYKIEGVDKVQKILFHRMQVLDEKDASGRNKVKPMEMDNFVMNVDYFIYAVGQILNKEFMAKLGVELTTNGLIKINDNFETSVAKIYAAGDCVNGGQTVVQAVSEGKKVAHYIIEKLRG